MDIAFRRATQSYGYLHLDQHQTRCHGPFLKQGPNLELPWFRAGKALGIWPQVARLRIGSYRVLKIQA